MSNESMRRDAWKIIRKTLKEAMPDQAVEKALRARSFTKPVTLFSIGKAAWQMASAAERSLGNQIKQGIVLTKYGHSKGEIPRCEILEAGHPVPDANSVFGAQKMAGLARSLTQNDQVLFLISGGGSALFELPLVPLEELQDITRQLLACGAEITEINLIRKRLSGVKGGRFAQLCAPAQVFSIVLSDVLGNSLESIASGPAAPDSSTSEQALEVVKKYGLRLSSRALEILKEETPKTLENSETVITGSVQSLCESAARAAGELGYAPEILTACLTCQAKEAGSFLAAVAQWKKDHLTGKPAAVIVGGETVVELKGKGMGGRNEELALSAARGLEGLPNAVLFSLGSDGTDGPTDAAGGIVDGETAGQLRQQGIGIDRVLEENDAYHALQKCGGLLKTGPTGTNVNDVAVLLLR